MGKLVQLRREDSSNAQMSVWLEVSDIETEEREEMNGRQVRQERVRRSKNLEGEAIEDTCVVEQWK